MSDLYDANMPDPPQKGNWRASLEKLKQSSYLAPTTSAVPKPEPVAFILDKVDVSGGQSVDTSEYPNFGGWSSEALNEKPQQIKINGHLIGLNYVEQRNDLIASLRVPTSDTNPGTIAMPFWGRFKVHVIDYNVSETNSHGMAEISLTFIRVGLAAESRIPTTTAKDTAALGETLAATCVDDFETKLSSDNLSVSAMVNGFNKMKTGMLSVIGRIQAAQSTLNNLTNQALSITNLIDQGIQSPRQFALALFGCATAIAAGVIGIKESVENLFSASDETSPAGTARNIQNITLLMLSAYDYSMDDFTPATTKELSTKNAMVALYRQACFAAAAALLPSIETVSSDKIKSLYSLLLRLEDSLDCSNPDVHEAVVALRIAVVESLQEKDLYNELHMQLHIAQPIITLAHDLGVSYDRMVELNPALDSQFFVKGPVTYV